MSIMTQSSKAQDRTLGVWYHNIQQGLVKLPRFQRFEAWDRGRITSFLSTIISNLPVGVTLALEVAGKEQFESRYISTADPLAPGTVMEHLLDGQQRLTAFWRAMHNNYEWGTFFVHLPKYDEDAEKMDADIEVRCISRWENKAKLRMPRWADDPAQCLKRGLIPISLCRPGDMASGIDNWLTHATRPYEPTENEEGAFAKYKAYTTMRDGLKTEITKLRERVTHFNLPYLSLPSSTTKDVALQVFINMNSNSKPLSLYDIIVAEVENVAGRSLHDLEAELSDTCPVVARYGEVSDLILATSALLQDKIPNARGMVEMDKNLLLTNWPRLVRGLQRLVLFLEGQRIFDAARLPTNAVLAVIAATYDDIPEHGDFLARAENLLRRYLWSAFFTDRYENSASSRAFADFKEIKTLLLLKGYAEDDLARVPVLNRAEFPLADVDALLAAGWPKAAGIEARGVLAVTTYLGALDFADNRPATFESIQKREYHHVFPDALLAEAEINSFRALNCALITWKTNRMIGRKDPLDYLKERVNWADENVVRQRLKSHLIPYDVLTRAHYANLKGAELKQKLEKDFDEFMRERARLVVAAMNVLANGGDTTLDAIWNSHVGERASQTGL